MAVELREPHKAKIRKDHICQGCGKVLKKYETVTASSYADGGTAWTFYECDECVKYRENHCWECRDREMCIQEDYYVGLLKERRREREQP